MSPRGVKGGEGPERRPAFGRFLHARRLAWGLTREELALELHVSWRQVTRYEREGVVPSALVLSYLLELCERRGENRLQRAYQMLCSLRKAA